jgi:ATP-dependent Clp protease protease subunit
MTVENEMPASEARALRLLPRNGKKGWYDVRNAFEGVAEISIHDEIGGFGVTAKSFIDEVKALGAVKSLNLHINSPGGSVFEGLAIYNYLKRMDAEITVYVDGLAASIASVIAMAGKVVLPENAMLMIHNASGVAMGTAEDMLAMAAALEKINASLVTVYTAKTGKDADEIAALMAAETWMTAAEAKEMGFADEIIEPVRAAASFDVSRFLNAPEFLAQVAEEPEVVEPEVVAEVVEPEPEVVAEVVEPAEPVDERDYHAEAVEIAALCTEANAPASEYIAAKASPADVKAKLDTIGTIRDLCNKAKAPALFDGLKNKSVDEARNALFDHILNSQSAEILTAITADQATPPKPAVSTAEIYARRNKRSSK